MPECSSTIVAFARRQPRSFSRTFECLLNPLRTENPWQDGIDGFVAQGVLPAVLPEVKERVPLPATSLIEPAPQFDLRAAEPKPVVYTDNVVRLFPAKTA